MKVKQLVCVNWSLDSYIILNIDSSGLDSLKYNWIDYNYEMYVPKAKSFFNDDTTQKEILLKYFNNQDTIQIVESYKVDDNFNVIKIYKAIDEYSNLLGLFSLSGELLDYSLN